MKVKEESEKVVLKLNIQKTKIMTSGPISSWQIDGKKLKQWDLFWGAPKVIADDDCSHEIKRHLLFGKAMASLDSILKSRDITLPTKVHLVKAVVFPVVVYGCENWTIKKAEHWRIDALNVPLEKALENPLDCVEMKSVNTEGNKPWIFIWGTCTQAEAPILWPPDMKSQLIRKDPRCWERLKVGGEEIDRGFDGWMASPTRWTWVWADSGR